MEIEIKEEFNEEEISNEPELEYLKIEPVDLDPKIPGTGQELDTLKFKPFDKDRIPLFVIIFAL